MRFSIIVPNFNSGAVLERALRSVLEQDYPDLQLIVIDAGSSDASRAVLENYRPRFAVFVCEPDRGQADGLNKGFRLADGDIFGWLCADDVLEAGALRHVAQYFEAHPEADVVTGSCRRHFPDGSQRTTPPAADAWTSIGAQNVIEQPSTFWRARLHRRAGELDTSFQLAFDWDFWCRLRLAGARLATTRRVLSHYYFSAENKSGRAGDLHAREAFRILRRYGPLRGNLAHIYAFLYRHFDLHGFFDEPPACSGPRRILGRMTLGGLRALIGRRLLCLYNWHFASCQERGLKWW